MTADLKKSVEFSLTYLRRSGRSLKVTKVLSTVFGAILVALSPWVDEQSFASANTVSEVLLFVGLALTITGSLVLIWVDDTAPDILADNVRLADELSQVGPKFDYYEAYQDHLLARLSIDDSVRSLVEDAILERGRHDDASLAGFAKTILSMFVERRAVLFGITDEYWNFSVYKFDKDKDRLVCIACRREVADDEDVDHREWQPGEGHVGLCFSRDTEIIFSDSTRPELKAVLEATGTNTRNYDASRYVSLASFPISNDGERPLGVLIATSDRPGRFKNDDERAEDEWENADTLRDVASSLAIIFQLIHTDRTTGGSEYDDDNKPASGGSR